MMEKLSPFVDIASLEIESLRRIKRPKRFSEEESEETENTTNSSNAVFGFPNLPEEPNRDMDQSVLCRMCVRLPDGRRIQRSFLKSESVQLLWSFCYSQIGDESSERKRRFKLIQGFPGDYKNLYFGSNTTFEQSGLANSLVSVTWLWRIFFRSVIRKIISFFYQVYVYSISRICTWKLQISFGFLESLLDISDQIVFR